MTNDKTTSPKVSKDTLDKLVKVGSQTATGVLVRLGYRNCYMIGVHPLAVQPGQVMVGTAVTLRFVPQREDAVKAQREGSIASPHRNALESIGPGEVLVVDTGGSLEAGIAGDMYVTRIQYRGARGMVVHGSIRDLTGIKATGLPVFTTAIHGSGMERALMSVGMNEWIQCGGCPVSPGDVILGDENGVVVIPAAIADQVADEGLVHEQEEEFIRLKLQAGASIDEAYPMNEATRAEYREWRAQRG